MLAVVLTQKALQSLGSNLQALGRFVERNDDAPKGFQRLIAYRWLVQPAPSGKKHQHCCADQSEQRNTD
jgi:hypothetical protein